MQRTLKDFIARLAAKWNFDPSKVVRTVRVLQRGLEVELDDELVREIEEGQDMTLQVVEVNQGASPPIKGEWEMTIDAPGESDPIQQQGYELRLNF